MTTRRPPQHLHPERIATEPVDPQRGGPARIEWQCYRCELVTPLFGGGVKPREVDPQQPIRASVVRGHLRFWWRLLAQYRDGLKGAELRQREFSIWGGLGQPPQASKVWVRVDQVGRLKIEDGLQYRDGNNWPKEQPWAPAAYALFPAQRKPARPGQPEVAVAQLAHAGLQWQLQLGMQRGPNGLTDEECETVRQALRWWASFGGVGARTRRGLGAVQVFHAVGQGEQLLEPVQREEVERAGCRLVLAPQSGSSATDAWKRAIKALQEFRQGPGVGRKPGSPTPGRSYWPEPDAIRRITGKYPDRHRPQHPAGNVWPRAYFGLPIVFHFKGAAAGEKPEPKDHTLQPKSGGRMPSPLILRPMFKDGKWWPGALLLPYQERLRELSLELKGPESKHVIEPDEIWPQDDAKRAELSRCIKPMSPAAPGAVDPLQAFLHFFVSRSAQRDGKSGE